MPLANRYAQPVCRTPELRRESNYWRGDFQAMASPCQFLTDVYDEAEARELLHTVANEAWRIEDKFSRYVKSNIVDAINSSNGKTVSLDDETANLLEFADGLFEMSEGRFDITSGALRKVWNFNGSNRVPAQSDIEHVLPLIGWDKIIWNRPNLKLRRGMQIDLGGIGKEYAVDRAADLVSQKTDAGCLVNFGGDLVAVGQPKAGSWRVGIESVETEKDQPDRIIHIHRGALTTSGDAHRYLIKNGIRYGHVLDPTTGWPVQDAPRSITVAADTCTQAGMLATLAMLGGAGAEVFLEQQLVQHWCLR